MIAAPRRVLVFCALCPCVPGAGCAEYARVKSELVDQSLRGVQLVRESAGQRRALLDELFAARRRGLDAAFDADARSAALSPGWVIDARKAYAAALDAAHAQEEAARRADSATAQNLDAIDLSVRQLQLLHGLEARLSFSEIP